MGHVREPDEVVRSAPTDDSTGSPSAIDGRNEHACLFVERDAPQSIQRDPVGVSLDLDRGLEENDAGLAVLDVRHPTDAGGTLKGDE